MEITDNEKMLSIITQFNEMIKMVNRNTLSIEDALLSAQIIFDNALKTFYVYPSWWLSYKHQMIRTMKLLEKYGSGDEFAPYVMPAPPDKFVPLTMYEIPLLIVILPDRNGIYSVQRTFDAYRDSIRFDRYGDDVNYDKYRDNVNSDPTNLRLVPGIENKPGIYWVAFDPNANKAQCPKQYWANNLSVTHLAHVHVLAAVMLFTDWLKMWDRGTLLFPTLPGYQSYHDGKWEDTLSLFCDDHGCMRLNRCHSKQADRRWSVPTFRYL